MNYDEDDDELDMMMEDDDELDMMMEDDHDGRRIGVSSRRRRSIDEEMENGKTTEEIEREMQRSHEARMAKMEEKAEARMNEIQSLHERRIQKQKEKFEQAMAKEDGRIKSPLDKLSTSIQPNTYHKGKKIVDDILKSDTKSVKLFKKTKLSKFFKIG